MNRSGKKFHGETNSFEKTGSSNYQSKQIPTREPSETTSKEHVELSLEVEIADSLKQLLATSDNCTSRLLDVTIIRPNGKEYPGKVETNTVAFGKSEIKDLISIIEREKVEKERQIEEEKRKINQKILDLNKKDKCGLSSSHRASFSQGKSSQSPPSPRGTSSRCSPHRLNSPNKVPTQDRAPFPHMPSFSNEPSFQKAPSQRPSSLRRQSSFHKPPSSYRPSPSHIPSPTYPHKTTPHRAVLSDIPSTIQSPPPQRPSSSHKKPHTKHLKVRSEISRPNSPKASRNSQSKHHGHRKDVRTRSGPPDLTQQKNKHGLDIQCLRGEFDFKFPTGDLKNADKATKLKEYKNIESRLLELCEETQFRDNSPPRSANTDQDSTKNSISTNGEQQQVYATQKTTFEDLKRKFRCTNSERKGKPNEPCVCQHCGMIGVLLDTQKGPVLPANTQHISPWTPSEEMEMREKKSSWKDNLLSLRNIGKQSNGRSQDCLIKQINLRLRSLEERVSIQEETAVTRDYFKLIMNKLLLSYKTALGGDNSHKQQVKRDISAQCGKSAIDSDHYGKRFYRPFNVNKDVGTRRTDNRRHNYTVNTALVEHDLSTETADNDTVLESELSYVTYSKQEVKIGRIDEVDEPQSETGKSNEKSSSRMWRWGEEIIKPGFDLKTKIVSLLEEKLKTISQTKNKLVKESNVSVQVEINRNPCQGQLDKYGDQTNKYCEKMIPCNDQRITFENQRTQFENHAPKIPASPHGQMPTIQENCALGGVSIVPERLYNHERGISHPETPNIKTNVLYNYPLDTRKATDDSTFRRNIEASKEATQFKKHRERWRREYYDSGDSSTTVMKSPKRRTKHKKSKSEICLKHLKKKESRKHTKTLLASPKTCSENGTETSFRVRHEKLCKVYHAKEVYSLENKKSNLNSKAVKISYINPKASLWKEDSLTSCTKKSSEQKSKVRRKTERSKFKDESLQDKLQYLKNLAKSKNIDEEVIWESIMKQMKSFSNSNKAKGDTVKIQIPTEALYRLHKQDDNITELELTMEDLQSIIKKSKPMKDSSCTLNGGNLIDNRKKLQELHQQLGAILNKNRPKFAI